MPDAAIRFANAYDVQQEHRPQPRRRHKMFPNGCWSIRQCLRWSVASRTEDHVGIRRHIGTFTVDANELIFAGRHVAAHDSPETIEVLVAGQSCRDDAFGVWVPSSARVTLDNGEFIFGCAQDAPPR